MSDTLNPTAAAPAQAAAAPAKPKRPKAKSLLMIGEQTNALFENARLAKERGEKVGWSASIFPQEIAETLGFSNQSFFGRYFKQYVGLSPMAFRSSGAEE